MAKKLYIEAGGVSHKAKKMYTEVGGVSHKVKKLYAEVNGLSKLVYNAWQPMAYTFTTYPNMAGTLYSGCHVSTWFAGFRADGKPSLDIVTNNDSYCSGGGEPLAVMRIALADETARGKTMSITYERSFDTNSAASDLMRWLDKTDKTGGVLYLTGQKNQTGTLTFSIDNYFTAVEFRMRVGAPGYQEAHFTITSITIDGEEIL